MAWFYDLYGFYATLTHASSADVCAITVANRATTGFISLYYKPIVKVNVTQAL